nr:ROK family protein [Paenibacillus sp. AR247]
MGKYPRRKPDAGGVRFSVFIDNDVRVNMYGEWRFGAGRGCRNLMLITLGTGLGSGNDL